MAYNMSTKFTDITGEEYEFLGTNITFSESALIRLEWEHDSKEDQRFVERLISTGFFEEEWTDYYAETDAEDDGNDDDDDDHPDGGGGGGDEVEAPLLAKDSAAEAAAEGEGTAPQCNVPISIPPSDTAASRFTFPSPGAPDAYGLTKRTPNGIHFKATLCQQLRGRGTMLNVVN